MSLQNMKAGSHTSILCIRWCPEKEKVPSSCSSSYVFQLFGLVQKSFAQLCPQVRQRGRCLRIRKSGVRIHLLGGWRSGRRGESRRGKKDSVSAKWIQNELL